MPKHGIIVQVTGGRAYTDSETAFGVWNSVHRIVGIRKIIHGKASGLDSLAMQWAIDEDVKHKPYPADWDNLEAPGAVIKTGYHGAYNAMAGFSRNQAMLDEHDAHLLTAFPGGPGTRQMIDLCMVKNDAGKAPYPMEMLIVGVTRRDEMLAMLERLKRYG